MGLDCVWLIGALCLVVLALASSGASARVMIQGFYWDVPFPKNAAGPTPWWWDILASVADDLAAAGFTDVWIPPVLKCDYEDGSVGYDPFDDYDIGSKKQKGGIPTRYGTREQLQRCAATLRANGLDIIADLVLNHRNGDDGYFNFRYPNAYEEAGKGRFPKSRLDFHPNVPDDPDVYDTSTYGRDVAHVNGQDGRIGAGLIESTGWLTRALDLQGFRLDYVKGISYSWLLRFLNSGEMKGKFAVAEFWDGDEKKLADYAQSSLQGRASAFDFPLRDMLRDMCRGNGSFDMSTLHRAGFTGRDAAHSVTFVENHDTARKDAVPDKALAYAYILTSEGLPCVFYPDYRDMKQVITNLVWINRMIAEGPTRERWKTNDVFCYERTGGKHLLVGLNDNPSEPMTIRPATGFGAGVRLHDYTGHAPDVTTDETGAVEITIPRNEGGNGYVCYSVTGIEGRPARRSFETTQVYEGAEDLDIKPADNQEKVQVCRIWAGAGQKIAAVLDCNTSDWTSETQVKLDLTGPEGSDNSSATFDAASAKKGELTLTPSKTGWHTFEIQSFDTPQSNRRPSYRLRVTYRASGTLDP